MAVKRNDFALAHRILDDWEREANCQRAVDEIELEEVVGARAAAKLEMQGCLTIGDVRPLSVRERLASINGIGNATMNRLNAAVEYAHAVRR